MQRIDQVQRVGSDGYHAASLRAGAKNGRRMAVLRLATGFAVMAHLSSPRAEPAAEPTPTPAEIELDWLAPQQCPSAAEIQARYAALLDGPTGGRGTMLARARVSRDGETWTLRLETTFAGVEDERTLEAASCDALGDAAALVFAVVLQPPSLEVPFELPTNNVPPVQRPRQPPSSPSPQRAQAAPVAPTESSTPRRSEDPRSRRLDRPSWTEPYLRPYMGVEYGALPKPTALAGLVGGFAWSRARLEFSAMWLSPQRVAGPAASAATAQYFIGGVRGCLHPRRGRWEFPQCVGIEGGTIWAQSRGRTEQSTTTGPWLAPSIGSAASYRRGRWALIAGFEIAPPVLLTRLFINGEAVFRARTSVRGLLGVEFFFPVL